MIQQRNVIVVDIDGTLTVGKEEGQGYAAVRVSEPMRAKLRELKARNYWIILYSSRNMRTYDGNIGAILKHTAPVLVQWLADNDIPYDELHLGKPWCGHNGFYIDDRAVRPREFLENSLDELARIIARDRVSE
jgi:capsule biosynthesis phosphatase